MPSPVWRQGIALTDAELDSISEHVSKIGVRDSALLTIKPLIRGKGTGIIGPILTACGIPPSLYSVTGVKTQHLAIAIFVATVIVTAPHEKPDSLFKSHVLAQKQPPSPVLCSPSPMAEASPTLSDLHLHQSSTPCQPSVLSTPNTAPKSVYSADVMCVSTKGVRVLHNEVFAAIALGDSSLFASPSPNTPHPGVAGGFGGPELALPSTPTTPVAKAPGSLFVGPRSVDGKHLEVSAADAISLPLPLAICCERVLTILQTAWITGTGTLRDNTPPDGSVSLPAPSATRSTESVGYVSGRFVYRDGDIDELADLALQIADGACKAFEQTPACIDVDLPCYCVGDLHGNFRDLLTVWSTFVPLGQPFASASPLLFLGDYGDRGGHGVEVVLFLLCQKLLHQRSVYLLRGNHETKEVNIDEDSYSALCFLGQCRQRFGKQLGTQVCDAFASAFRYLPLCAVIGSRYFAAHGGIPRRSVRHPAMDDPRALLQRMRSRRFKRFLFDEDEDSDLRDENDLVDRIVASDLMWSDPIKPHLDGDSKHITVLRGDDLFRPDNLGFAFNTRGISDSSAGYERYRLDGCNIFQDFDVISYGNAAISHFLERTELVAIIRAHEEKRGGIEVSLGNRVVTVFSSSNYQNHKNACGVCLVMPEQLRLISFMSDETGSCSDGQGSWFSPWTWTNRELHRTVPFVS